MTSRPQLVDCIFCGQRGLRAREDVIPKWMSAELKGTPPFSTDFVDNVRGSSERRRSTANGSLANLKLKYVCQGCNNEWMSGLEDSTRPVLEPLIRGVERTLTPAERRQVAAWCQLKAITLDAYYEGTFEGIRHLPTATARTFAQGSQPLTISTVALGQFDPPKAGVMLPWGRHMVSVDAQAVHGGLNIVTATFAFGHLLAEVVVGDWTSEPSDLSARLLPHPTWSIPCWPDPDQVQAQWPPGEKIRCADFDEIAQPYAYSGWALINFRGSRFLTAVNADHRGDRSG